MTSTLRDAADSAIETVSGLMHDAREQFDQLSLPPMRRRSRRSWWIAVGAVAVLLVGAGAVWGRRRAGTKSAALEHAGVTRGSEDDLHRVA